MVLTAAESRRRAAISPTAASPSSRTRPHFRASPVLFRCTVVQISGTSKERHGGRDRHAEQALRSLTSQVAQPQTGYVFIFVHSLETKVFQPLGGREHVGHGHSSTHRKQSVFDGSDSGPWYTRNGDHSLRIDSGDRPGSVIVDSTCPTSILSCRAASITTPRLRSLGGRHFLGHQSEQGNAHEDRSGHPNPLASIHTHPSAQVAVTVQSDSAINLLTR